MGISILAGSAWSPTYSIETNMEFILLIVGMLAVFFLVILPVSNYLAKEEARSLGIDYAALGLFQMAASIKPQDDTSQTIQGDMLQVIKEIHPEFKLKCP